MSFEDLLKAETERLGFPLFGVTPVSPPSHLQTYQQWVDAGLHAGMEYLAVERARQRRANPALIQPEARSMLVVGMRYASPESIPDGDPNEATGRVAAYAWGDDYHEVIPQRLEEIGQVLEKHLRHEVGRRSYTDTGPILERDFAQSAGLGWSGKNTCLISPTSGSYYLLGEMFMDVEIEPGPAFPSDHCGSCTRCIQACPTQAIRLDRMIDAGHCISYLTIENKGPIPPELRSSLGDWIFGCDICQMVCPWNLRFAVPQGHPALAARPNLPRPVLRYELRLSPQEFNQKFRGSPVKRAKRRGYLRNVAVALGNARDTAAIPDLSETMQNEPEPIVRAHAAWALGQMHARLSRAVLDAALLREPDPMVAGEIRAALA